MFATKLIAKLHAGPVHIGSITFSLEMRNCGKCSRCPHGPYLYARTKRGKRTYIGNANNTKRIQRVLDALTLRSPYDTLGL